MRNITIVTVYETIYHHERGRDNPPLVYTPGVPYVREIVRQFAVDMHLTQSSKDVVRAAMLKDFPNRHINVDFVDSGIIHFLDEFENALIEAL